MSIDGRFLSHSKVSKRNTQLQLSQFAFRNRRRIIIVDLNVDEEEVYALT